MQITSFEAWCAKITQILLHEIIEQKLYHAIRLYLCESIFVIFAPRY